MIRTTKTSNKTGHLNWSHTATFVLLAFLAIGAVELGAHQLTGAVVCFFLAAVYVPLRFLRGRLLSPREGR